MCVCVCVCVCVFVCVGGGGGEQCSSITKNILLQILKAIDIVKLSRKAELLYLYQYLCWGGKANSMMGITKCKLQIICMSYFYFYLS